jgi:2-amino-4-hydroxy-6-hydroxymethyldihydropteridine diphosphokinase
MPRVFVGAGSNLEPVAALRAGVAALERAFRAVRVSAVYRGAAVGAPAPDYLNIVVAFTTELPPDDVKAQLRAIEAAAGRTRGAALVALDLDLLIYGARVDAARRLPHPDVLRRAYVLVPLAELVPELAHPVTGEPLASVRSRSSRSADSALIEAGALETAV